MRRSHSGRVHWSLAQPAGRAGPSLPDPRRIPAAGGPRPCPPRPRRPLVYGALSGLLAVVYLSGVVLLQGLFRALTGQESNLAIVVATLAAAAFFQPLRRRLQAVIDRRFYRRRYHAAATLAAFTAHLRDEVDLASLTEELVRVVDETMQPSHVSLWLRVPSRRAAVPSSGYHQGGDSRSHAR